jgi:hypothetical protein
MGHTVVGQGGQGRGVLLAITLFLIVAICGVVGTEICNWMVKFVW